MLVGHDVASLAARAKLLRCALAGDAAVAAHPEVAGNAVRLIVDNAQFRPALLGDLERATKVIDVQEFLWTNDGLGREVGDLLKRKAAQGVEVNVQLDGTGSAGFPFSLHPRFAKPSYRRFVADMRESGVNVVENWRYGRRLASGAPASWDHRKLFMVDGEVAYVGGINLSAKFEGWHDVMVRLEGPAAAQAGAEFLGRWVDLGGAVSPRHAAALADAELAPRLMQGVSGGGPSGAPQFPSTAIGARARVITNSPGAVRELTRSYLGDIRGASRRLWVTSPSIGSPEAVRELIAAKQRGVDVRVVTTSYAMRDGDPFTHAITNSFVDELVEAGVQVFEHPRTVHAKVLLVDDAATVSSFNLNMRSHAKDMEAGVRVRDDGFTLDVEGMFQEEFSQSRRVMPEHGKTAFRQSVRGLRELFGWSF